MITAKKITLTISNSGTNQSILNGIDFEIPQRRITFFLGKSGAGKTSLMKCIAQLTPAYQGSILWNDTDIKSLAPQERGRHLGFVSQHFNLFPHMTVLGNCTNALINVFGLTQPEAEKKAYEKLALVEMTQFEKSYPNQLSGGQQQRAAIARALCLDPQLLLFDEPTSALDPENSASLQLVIKNLLEKGITIAIASHDMTFVKGLLDRVYFLENGNVAEFYDQKTNGLDSCPLIKTFLDV